ncbi:LysR family transcriptional regulator [Pseudomonas kairouanensis]|uniref:LysR family transcriptional regulator n=1 Tax=Pseudomonas kairouanensis TaxID=2293832 RepID=A0A4Z0AME2_9PSED|nr:LysR family transcriptional regulator [Pseudomonas kairouanensis]TFY87404.1 LysR family transcriptional regulator [Pseudomonas kairouanensis]
MNWDDARVLLALGREHTLRKAGRILRLDQATVGRRIAAMEGALGSTLFLRTSGGFQLTEIGQAALQAAEKMEQAALELSRRVRGADDEFSGEVRISTTDSLAFDYVIPALKQLRVTHPDIHVLLDSSSEMVNLSQREADIAIRNQRPENPDLILRKLAQWPMGLFASPGYLARKGTPLECEGLKGHDVVMYEPYWRGREVPTLVDETMDGGTVVLAVTSSMTVRRAVAEGLGIGELPIDAGQRDALTRVWPTRERHHPYEVWMVTHKDLRHTARLRVVINHLAASFAATRLDRS